MARRQITEEQRAEVIELKRQHSYAEVVELTGLPLGTVRTICRRSKAFTGNPTHRQMFALPEPIQSTSTALTVPQLPEQAAITGIKEVDAMLWLQEVIKTGDQALIDKALEARAKIKLTNEELATKYRQHLVSEGAGWTAAFKTIGFGELDGKARVSIEKKAARDEAISRFGNDPEYQSEAELWAINTLEGVKLELMREDRDEIARRFKLQPELLPHTLDDCLHELNYWDKYYWLIHALTDGEPHPAASEREHFVFGLMVSIRPRSRAEAKRVMEHLLAGSRMEWAASNDILINIVS